MKLANIPTLAKLLGVSAERIRRDIADGHLAHMPVGRRKLVTIEEAQAYYANLKTGIDIVTLSEHLGMTTGAIRKAIHEGWMPYAMDGKKFVFDLDEVREAVVARMNMSGKKD